MVKGKLRPVLLLQDRPRGVLKEIVALRMVRLEELPEEHQRLADSMWTSWISDDVRKPAI